MNEKEIRFIDLFGGIGGFRYGLEKASGKRDQESRGDSTNTNRKLSTQGWSKSTFNCTWYCDSDKYATQTYNKNFQTDHEPTDITTVDAKDIPDFDMLCAGFPCQSFSIAGKRQGFKDTRGTMFFEICRIAQAKRPRLLLLENVKGLLSHDEGKTFATILASLSELGYVLEWQVLNSKNFGVPQNRERVFIIGHLRANRICGRQVFPIRETSKIIERGDSERNVASTLQSPGHACGNYRGMNMIADFCNDEGLGIRRENISPCLATRKHSEQDVSTMPPMVAQRFPLKYLNRNQKNIEGEHSFTVDGANTGGVVVHNLQPRSPDRPSLKYSSGGSGHLKRKDGKTYCLDSGNCQAVQLDTRIRRLTPIECERLQGFPDGWTSGVSDTQRYKQLGNAVTTNVIYEIGRKILEVM